MSGARSATTRARAVQAGSVILAILFLGLHLPYLPASLEDLDSVNFALGIRDYDVARHQPHPPGYPVFILIAKAVRSAGFPEPTALALVSVAGGALGVLAIAALFRRLDGRDGSWSTAATAVAMTAPLYWFTAARPLSDIAGLAAAVAVQAMTLGAVGTRGLAIAAGCAGLAAGLRSQVVWLTAPLLIMRGLSAPTSSPRPRVTAIALLGFIAGLLLWFLPLVVISGGPAAYGRALSDQGAEDFGNIQMLWNVHGARDVLDALYYAFVAPWATWPMAVLVLVCAALGVVWSYRRARHALLMLAVAFGPYLLFDLVFQEAFTSRYALPLVVPVAYLAVAGLRLLPYDSGLALAIAVAMFDAHVGGTSISAYASEKAPAFRLLDEMSDAARSMPEAPVLAMDRRQNFDFRRPIVWVGDAMPRLSHRLPAPPQHEWLEPVNYWNSGGRAPVWFVVDPMRTSIDLVQHGDPRRYRWPLRYPQLVGGARPNQMDWYRVDRPEWYVGQGWALTPEAAGVSERDGTGLAHAPIEAWARRSALAGVLMIGGRNLEPSAPTFTVAFDGETRDSVDALPPGPFLRFVDVPPAGVAAAGTDYFQVTVTTTPAARVAVEQFDVSSSRPVFGYGNGWHEQELNPRTGLRWRWLSEKGELRLRIPTARATLHLEGESPLTYFSRGSRLVVRAGGVIVLDKTLSAEFSLDIPIDTELRLRRAGAWSEETISLETDQVFAPADRSRRSADRRHLGLRIFKCELRAGQ